jgi:hypothetical protein
MCIFIFIPNPDHDPKPNSLPAGEAGVFRIISTFNALFALIFLHFHDEYTAAINAYLANGGNAWCSSLPDSNTP